MRCRSRSARVATVTCAFSSLLLAPSVPAAAFTIQTIAITGETAAGTGGGSYGSFSNPVLNESGEVAFTALLQQGGAVNASNDLGLWSGSASAPGLVARRGSAAPGAGGAPFTSFIAPPVLNDAGQTSFRGFLVTGGPVTPSNNEGIWSEASGSLALVGREGSQGAGVPAGQNYASSFSNPAFAAAGVAYSGSLVDGGTTTADNRALWAGSAAAPGLVARKGSVADGVGDGALYESFSGPVINGAGEVAFRAILDNGDDGLWRGAPGSLALVAREGSAAAGVAGATFGTLFSPEMNDAGRMVFQGLLSQGVGGVGASNDAGLWLGNENGLLLMAREGDSAPGTGDSFSSFASPSLNASGKAAFRAFLTGGTAVYVGDESSLDLVAASGDVAPGTNLGLGSATFSAVLDPVINDAGQVVFQAFLTGLGVTSDNDEALYGLDTIGNLVLIAREGAIFERRPGDSSIITEIALNTGPRSLGRSFNSAGEGQVTFWMGFLDGGEGVFITQVPEPGTAALLALGLIGLAARRRAGAGR